MSEASRLLARDRQASVEDIAIAAGVSRTTFYRAFPSRAQLLRAIEVQPEPDTRDRVLQATIRMLGTQTLKELSMDSLASEAGVSRANLYRLFPGKSALFKAILLAYSPFAPVMAVFAHELFHFDWTIAGVLGAALAHRRRRHALGADRPATFGARDVRLSVGVPVAPLRLVHEN